ncbi:hypothetical protein ACGFNU_34870 [Spirillospora sp. NPDC048911]|uniref:hypothetical protein n=1 Tax=Spirillospora sp. NPDC048911 TaxID=3364527 RepID=UPI003712DEC5
MLLKDGHDQDEVVELARRRNLSEAKAKEFLRGEVEFGFRWDVLEALLIDCGADAVSVEVAGELFAKFPLREQPLDRAAHAPARPPAPDGPAVKAGDESPRDPDGAAGHGSLRRTADHDANRTPRPDPRNATTPAQFIAAMFEYRVLKGNRSYRKMAAAVGSRYAHTTFSGLKTRTTLPALELAMSFITACGAHPDELGEWKEAWQRIALAQTTPGDEPPEDNDLQGATDD